jgi:hypothetical protein
LVACLSGCSSGSEEDSTPATSQSSTLSGLSADEREVRDVVKDYLSALDDGDYKRAERLRCSSYRLDHSRKLMDLYSDAVIRLRSEVGQFSSASLSAGISGDDAVVSVKFDQRSEALVKAHREAGRWRVCGQQTRYAEATRKKLGRMVQNPLPEVPDFEALFAAISVPHYEPGDALVPAIQPSDSESGVLRRVEFRLRGRGDRPDILLGATTYASSSDMYRDELVRGSDPLDNSLGVLNATGDHDRGFRYLGSYNTFIQPDNVGPFSDTISITIGQTLVVVSVGQFYDRGGKSTALDVADQVIEIASR